MEQNKQARCPNCYGINLDMVLHAAQFEHLPSPSEAGPIPCTEYIHKITTFTTESLQNGASRCDFCCFLLRVSCFAANVSVPSLLDSKEAAGLDPGDPRLQDGDGFTLAATSSSFLKSHSWRLRSSSLSLDNTVLLFRPPRGVEVWLVVLKGNTTLERLIFEAEVVFKAKRATTASKPLEIISTIARHIETTGAWVAEVEGAGNFTTPLILSHHRLVSPSSIDYALLKAWLDHCSRTHLTCMASTVSSGIIPHMKLIDCQTRKLVTAKPDMRYLALSYVWGNDPPDKYNYPSLPLSLPQTIEDSMTVALEVGIRYIWIDRYCIWQDDPNHKMSQILQMTKIYGGAVATIATCNSGSDPKYGLPGVSRSRKPPQIQCRVESSSSATIRVLVSGHGEKQWQQVRDSISQSPWESRAWTFQEAVLSPRVLYFSDHDVSFACSDIDAYEHFSHPILTPEVKNISLAKSRSLKAKLVENHGVRDLVYGYSNRKMKFSSDALNAFLGVLGAWASANENCYHYCGLPMRFPRGRKLRDCTDLELCEPLWSSLCWYLDFAESCPGKRREGFPTWSWLSIEGRIRVSPEPYFETVGGSTSRFDVLIKGKPMTDWCQFIRTGGLSLSPFDWGFALRIEGLIFPIGPFQKISFFPDQEPSFYYPLGEDKKTSRATVLEFFPDVGTALDPTTQFEAVSTFKHRVDYDNYAIVFRRVGGAAKRFGLLKLHVRALTPLCIEDAKPHVDCDVERMFGAVRGSVVLE